MRQAIQIRRGAQTTVAQQVAGQRVPNRAMAQSRNRTMGQGTPVNLPTLFWGGSLLLLAAYFLGGGTPEKPLRRRKVQDESTGGSVASDAVSALRNLGYSRSEALRAVNAARRSGARSFEDVMREANRQLA